MTRKYSLVDLIDNKCNILKISSLNMEAFITLSYAIVDYDHYCDSNDKLYSLTYGLHQKTYSNYVREMLSENPSDFNLKLFLGLINPALLLYMLDTDTNIKTLVKSRELYNITTQFNFKIEAIFNFRF